ncbi:MAG: hypothetical protein ACPG31_07400 [Planctomycetota bacterium]
MSSVTSEQKRRLMRLAVLVIVLIATVFALLYLAESLEEAKRKEQVTATETAVPDLSPGS